MLIPDTGSGLASVIVPLGVAPPPGLKWVLSFHDEFDQDPSGRPDSSRWNGGSGGLPSNFCNNQDYFGSNAPGLGYSGDDCHSHFGTYPNAPYEQITNGLGLAVQGLHSAAGDNAYTHNQFAGVNTNGKFVQRYGYFEWSAKLPSDHNGEGDGWHTDLWCTSPDRTVNHGPEIDLNEKVYGTRNQTYTNFSVFDGGDTPVGKTTYGAPGNPDLSAAFHTYGFAWRNDGLGIYGSVQGYVDGQPITAKPMPINNLYWSAGMWCWGGWMQQTVPNDYAWGEANPVGTSTSNKNPLIVRYFRIWKAQ